MSDITFDSSSQQASVERLPIPNFEDRYEIDILGNVYSMFDNVGHKSGRLKSNTVTPRGYVVTKLSINGKARDHFIHRLLMLTFRPIENSDKLQVNHIDGIKTNNSLSNLEWCTSRENIRHAWHVIKVSYVRCGEDSSRARFTENDIREIRRLATTGMTQEAIGKIFNASQRVISKIVTRKSWKHLE